MSPRPLSAAIYWRRRLLIVAVGIAVAWGALMVIGSFRGQDDSVDTPAPVVAATTAPAPVAGALDVTLTGSESSCDPEQIRLTPVVPGGQLTRGKVTVNVVVSSTQATSCTLQPAASDLIAVISANGTPVWDSTVCKAALLTQPVQVSAGWSTLASTTWSGRGSGGSCSSKEGYASPGKYTLQIGTLGGEPGKVGFSLGAKPQPKPTKTS